MCQRYLFNYDKIKSKKKLGKMKISLTSFTVFKSAFLVCIKVLSRSKNMAKIEFKAFLDILNVFPNLNCDKKIEICFTKIKSENFSRLSLTLEWRST